MSTLEYKGYRAHVEWDPEPGLFHGEVLDTRDVITFQGKSVEEVQDAFVTPSTTILSSALRRCRALCRDGTRTSGRETVWSTQSTASPQWKLLATIVCGSASMTAVHRSSTSSRFLRGSSMGFFET